MIFSLFFSPPVLDRGLFTQNPFYTPARRAKRIMYVVAMDIYIFFIRLLLIFCYGLGLTNPKMQKNNVRMSDFFFNFKKLPNYVSFSIHRSEFYLPMALPVLAFQSVFLLPLIQLCKVFKKEQPMRIQRVRWQPFCPLLGGILFQKFVNMEWIKQEFS